MKFKCLIFCYLVSFATLKEVEAWIPRSQDSFHIQNCEYSSYERNGRADSEFDRIYYSTSYDNTANFSSGISSYQGTSTGPGPNGGYPGAPRGVYETNYIDHTIYPNTYMNIYRR